MELFAIFQLGGMQWGIAIAHHRLRSRFNCGSLPTLWNQTNNMFITVLLALIDPTHPLPTPPNMFFLKFFFVYLVSARMRDNTHTHQEEHATGGEGGGRTKQWGTETLGDLWKGEGWDGEHGE